MVGFHENLVTFQEPKLQDFSQAQRMRFKKCSSSSRCNIKAGKSGSVAPKCKIAENLHRIDRHRPKIGLNPNFLDCSNSRAQGQICIRGVLWVK